MNYAGEIGVGRHVVCAAHGHRTGVVVAVHGTETPASCGSLGGGMVAYGGRATLDVAFDDGFSRHVPESIVRGLGWTVLDRVSDAAGVAAAVERATAAVAARKLEEAAAATRRDEERRRHAAENPHLVRAADKPDWTPSRVAAENIRRELKRVFPAVKFRVTKDGYDSVRIHWTDGPTTDAVGKITGKYEGGHFDGMRDIYESDPDATFADVFGDPKYVTLSREWTVEGVRAAWEKAGLPGSEVTEGWSGGNDWAKAERFRRTWSDTDLTGLPAPAAVA